MFGNNVVGRKNSFKVDYSIKINGENYNEFLDKTIFD